MAKIKRKTKIQPARKSESQKPQKKTYPALLWAVLFLGVVIKIAYLFNSRQSPFYEPTLLDPKYYHDWALQIIKGDWVGKSVFYGLPLYPFFVALCYQIFGISVTSVKVIQILFGLFSLFMIYKIGEKVFDSKTGILAAFIAIFYGPLFFHEVLFIPEALSIPLYTAAFYACLLLWEKVTMKRTVIFGLLCGLALLTKAGIALFFILTLILILVRQIKSRKNSAAIWVGVLAFLTPIAPATWHNWHYGHDFVLLTSHGGFNLYIGNNEKAEGVFMAPDGTGTNVDSQMQDARTIAERELGRALKPSEVSRFWSDKAKAFIKTRPMDFLRLTGKKIILFFDRREISDVEDYEFAKNFNPMLKIPWLNFTILSPFFFAGFIIFLKKSKYSRLAFIFVATYIFSIAFFFINARYRLPIISMLIVIASAGAMGTWEAVKKKNLVLIFWVAACLGLGAMISAANLVGTNWIKSYVNAGDIYLEKKDYGKALKFYDEAVRIEPANSKAQQARGSALAKLGRREEAKEAYLKAIEAEPNNASPYNDLGLWYDQVGDKENAERHFLKAIELKPNSSQAHNNLGMMYGKAGDLDKALQEFETSLRLNPHSPRALTNKGLILYKLGRSAEARVLWTKALQEDPSFEEAGKALRLAA